MKTESITCDECGKELLIMRGFFSIKMNFEFYDKKAEAPAVIIPKNIRRKMDFCSFYHLKKWFDHPRTNGGDIKKQCSDIENSNIEKSNMNKTPKENHHG